MPQHIWFTDSRLSSLQVVDGEKRVVEKLLSRRKLKRSYEYEVQWLGLHSDKNTWQPRDKCVSPPPSLNLSWNARVKHQRTTFQYQD